VWAERALALAERLDSDEDFLNALGARSYSLFHVGRHQEAVLLAEGALAIALASDSLRSQLQVSMALSLYCLPDDVRRSYVASRETAELGRRAGARAFEQTATLNAIEDGIWLGLWVECEEMIADVRSKVLPDNEHWVDMLECMLAAWRGDLVRGRELLQKARSAPNWGEHVASQTTGLTAESLFSYFNGDFAESLGFAERAVELDPTGINVTSAIARAVRAAAWMRDLEGLSRALAATAPLRGRFIAALRLETRAAIAGLEGRADESGELFDSAVEAWRLVESMLDVATTEMEALHVLGPGHPTAVMAKEAEDLFTEYGVAVLLERLREDLAR
ncbi:MAG: hypothetical protein ACRDV0_05260, partial [Acidimicrobiales bacterium]